MKFAERRENLVVRSVDVPSVGFRHGKIETSVGGCKPCGPAFVAKIVKFRSGVDPSGKGKLSKLWPMR